ncbi:hypothetical protein GGI12_004150 [Dipsacomyces acuminosporus]|nr:hypothetical protein GGI12_004150 [Dipsacomyces acuminosporus]
MLGSNMPATPTPASKRKRLRTPCSSIAGSLGKPLGSVPRLALRDEATQALFQEKSSLQRELNDLKEEVALLERAKALEEKDDAKVVDSLISKWQIACSAACDELFELLKPMMEAQRQASLQGFGSGFDQGESEDTNCFGFGRQKLQQQQQQQQQQDENAEQEADQYEEIDIPYMLKRFGIDPELF